MKTSDRDVTGNNVKDEPVAPAESAGSSNFIRDIILRDSRDNK